MSQSTAAIEVPDATASPEALDQADPLAGMRREFWIPPGPDGGEQLYFCGHSLGLQPNAVESAIQADIEDWRRLAVEAHFHGQHPWVDACEYLRDPLARLVGAQPDEVTAMNSLTINLHLMMVSFYQPTRTRFRVVIEQGAFPSDRYAVASQIAYHGYDPEDALLELTPAPGERTLSEDAIESVLNEHGNSIALVLLPGVQYYTGQAFDLRRITQAARQNGAYIGFDLAHAIGNVPLELNDTGCDFAVWCSYKYLNGGPGAVAGCFIHERHLTRPDLPRFAGWWGQNRAERFQMGPDFNPPRAADAWQVSNPSVFATTPVRVALEHFDRIGINQLRAKSVRMTGFLEALISERLSSRLTIITPRAADQRGSHLSLNFLGPADQGRELHRELKRRGIICDWREPDCLRLAPVPLYNTYADCMRLVEAIEQILAS